MFFLAILVIVVIFCYKRKYRYFEQYIRIILFFYSRDGDGPDPIILAEVSFEKPLDSWGEQGND